MKDNKNILKMHLLTEKSVILKEQNNFYVFKVDRRANKTEIKMAVEKAFSVKVDAVKTATMPGKPKRLGRYIGKTAAWKKAIVKLKEGQRIADFDNI